MPDKQERYRKRKSQQGFQRVEVLVPEAAVPLLKAYARTLRDAHSLGLDAPLFDGMKRQTDRRSGGTTEKPATNQRALTRSAPKTHAAQPEDSAQNKNQRSTPEKAQPDFSKGLLDE